MASQAGRTVAQLTREYYEFTVNAVERAIDSLIPEGATSDAIYEYSFPIINQAFPEMSYTRERLEMDLETLLIDNRAFCANDVWRMV